MYLLDTNVVSELRKTATGRANPGVLRWSETVPVEMLYLSAISTLELEMGILQMERRDAKQGAALRKWYQQAVLPAFDGRIVPVDHHVASRCARFSVPDLRPFRDGLIGATAAAHGYVLVTRNISDFAGMELELLDPWSK